MSDMALVVHGLIGTLCSGRVYPVVRAWGTGMPALVYRVVSDSVTPTLTGYSNRRECRVSVTCWAEDYTTAINTMASVATLMQAWSTSELVEGTGTTVSALRRDSRSDRYEDQLDGTDVPAYVIEHDYTLTLEET